VWEFARSLVTVRTQELRGRPRGFLQTYDGGSKRIWLVTVSDSIIYLTVDSPIYVAKFK